MTCVCIAGAEAAALIHGILQFGCAWDGLLFGSVDAITEEAGPVDEDGGMQCRCRWRAQTVNIKDTAWGRGLCMTFIRGCRWWPIVGRGCRGHSAVGFFLLSAPSSGEAPVQLSPGDRNFESLLIQGGWWPSLLQGRRRELDSACVALSVKNVSRQP